MKPSEWRNTMPPKKGDSDPAFPGRNQENTIFLLAKTDRKMRENVVRSYWSYVKRRAAMICFVFGLPHSDQDDVLEGAYEGLLKAIDAFDPNKGPADSWAKRLIDQRAKDKAKALHKLRKTEFSLSQPFQDTEPEEFDICDEHAQDHEERLLIRMTHNLDAAIAALRLDYRRVIILRYFNRYSDPEIAQEIGRPVGTVKTWIRQALNQLRVYIEMPEK